MDPKREEWTEEERKEGKKEGRREGGRKERRSLLSVYPTIHLFVGPHSVDRGICEGQDLDEHLVGGPLFHGVSSHGMLLGSGWTTSNQVGWLLLF